MKHVFAIVTAALVLAFALAGLDRSGHAGEAAKAPPGSDPVLLELFTSQGCSSCPPADRLASQLAGEMGFVVVSRPVTYWDRLGWKDTLAREENTQLQRRYAARGLEGRNGVYTPQIVVDGQYGTIGSDERDVRRLAGRAAMDHVAAIRIRHLADGDLAVGLGGASESHAELVLLALDSHESVTIARGENGGRRIAYTNVLLGEHRLGTWEGGKRSMVIPAERFATPGADRHALVLRIPRGGPVMAVQMVP